MAGDRWRRHLSVDVTSIDYPGATYFAPAKRFMVPSSPRTIRYVIIHITGGPATTEGPAINHFTSAGASAHYIVNRQGLITQMVREAHIANHVDNIHSQTNRDSIGIEHVNPWNAEARLHPTDAQYQASADLVAWLCRRYSIPMVHSTGRHTPGIRGHIEEQPNSGHTHCPNPAWDWERYIGMVQGSRMGEDVIAELAGARG